MATSSSGAADRDIADPVVYPWQRPDSEGKVVIEITIDERGEIVRKTVLQSLGPQIDNKCLAALENWRFQPATRNGAPIPSKQDAIFPIQGPRLDRNSHNARAHRLAAIIEDVTANAVQQIASAEFPTRWGKFRIYGFRAEFGPDGNGEGEEAVALVDGRCAVSPPLVRVHSQCLTGDVFHSLRCDCRQQLEMALVYDWRPGRRAF